MTSTRVPSTVTRSGAAACCSSLRSGWRRNLLRSSSGRPRPRKVALTCTSASAPVGTGAHTHSRMADRAANRVAMFGPSTLKRVSDKPVNWAFSKRTSLPARPAFSSSQVSSSNSISALSLSLLSSEPASVGFSLYERRNCRAMATASANVAGSARGRSKPVTAMSERNSGVAMAIDDSSSSTPAVAKMAGTMRACSSSGSSLYSFSSAYIATAWEHIMSLARVPVMKRMLLPVTCRDHSSLRQVVVIPARMAAVCSGDNSEPSSLCTAFFEPITVA
mmetsp:Transcript_13703/g.42648  ORF Transcript_13703/g.42648 Transcript_13703/m.42648 type:complete len:277 (+) Transcript_13703:379-1209(+)